jgi:hypothetical protein
MGPYRATGSRNGLGRSKKMNPYLTALKPLRKRQYLGNQLFAAALGFSKIITIRELAKPQAIPGRDDHVTYIDLSGMALQRS